jgi:hypothetical protein
MRENKIEPSVCPVCKGVGQVAASFYDVSVTGTSTGTGDSDGKFTITSTVNLYPQVQCRTCKGEGIVWPPCVAQPHYYQYPYPYPYFYQPNTPWYPWHQPTITMKYDSPMKGSNDG